MCILDWLFLPEEDRAGEVILKKIDPKQILGIQLKLNGAIRQVARDIDQRIQKGRQMQHGSGGGTDDKLVIIATHIMYKNPEGQSNQAH